MPDRELLTKTEFTRSFFQTAEDDLMIGRFALATLPEPLLREVIAQHNGKVNRILAALPAQRMKLRRDVEQLRIPTYAEFQARLAEKELRVAIPAEHRKVRDFHFYRSWVLEQPPLATALRDSFFSPRFSAFLPERQRRRHCLLVGRSGSGKSEVLKLLALATKLRGETLRRDAAMVLIDPHGDLAEQLARQQCFARNFQACPDDPDLVYLDPFLDAGRGRFPTINPLDLQGRSYSLLQREKLAQQLVSVFKSLIARDDYSLTLNMETLLTPCLSVLLQRPGSTFYDLLRFLDDEANHDLLALGFRSPNPGHRFFFESSFRDRRFDITKGALSTKAQALLNSRAFAAFLAQPRSTVDLEGALEAGKTIVLNCAIGKSGAQTAEALGRFLVGMILAIAFNRAAIPQRRRVPIWLFLDEAQRFISDELRVILSEARKYGLHLTLATQVIGQGMSTELTRVVLGNTAVQMIGGAGNDSQKIMAREMGVRPDFLHNLAVGEFAVKCGPQAPIRVRMSTRYLGRRTQMNAEEWAQLRAVQVQRYYRAEHLESPAAALEQPREVAPVEQDQDQPDSRADRLDAAAPDMENPFAHLPDVPQLQTSGGSDAGD